MESFNNQIRSMAPSNAVVKGGTLGTAVGTLVELAAAAAGVPLPTGSGTALTGVLVALFSYFARGGRKGEPV